MNLLREKLLGRDNNFNIEEQKREFADYENELELRFDILVYYDRKPLLILDTKYMRFEGKPDTNHLGQMNLYSDVKKVENCGLIFPGDQVRRFYPLQKLDLKLHILFIDLIANTSYEFNNKCDQFVNTLNQIIDSLKK